MFWNSRYQNTMSAAYAEASSARASSDTALTVDAIILASILVILGVGLSLAGIIVCVTVSVIVILAVQVIGKVNRRGRRWSA